MVTGWRYIDGNWYYFSSSGAMQVNWQQIDGNWYYFNSNGTMVHSGWYRLIYPGAFNNQPYYNYFNSDGVFITDSDFQGCLHGVSDFGDYGYAGGATNILYYSYCSSSAQNAEITGGINSWSNGTTCRITKTLSATANMCFYDSNFSSETTLARTYHIIDGRTPDVPYKKWSATSIYVDNDRIVNSGTIAHEIGHALGLSHRITNQYSIMCQTRWGRKVGTVQAIDWDVFYHLY